MQRAVHDNDCGDHVVLSVATCLAEPRHVTDRDLGNILHEDRNAIRLKKWNVFDVFDLEPLRQVCGAPAVHETHAADIYGLLPMLIVRPPTLTLALPIALITCGNVTP